VADEASEPKVIVGAAFEPTEGQIKARDRLVAEWRDTGVLPSNGDSGLYKLFQGLKSVGFPNDEVERICPREIQCASGPHDRKKQLQRLLDRW
jgi:hypothetical protein